MITRGIRTAALAAAPVALIAAGVSPAAAGAAERERFSYSECFQWEEEGATLCLQSEGRVHVVRTKSGNESVTLRATYSEQLLGPEGDVLSSYTSADKAHSLVKRGQEHVFTYKAKGVSSADGET